MYFSLWGGIFIVLFVGWQWSHAKVKLEMSNGGRLTNERLADAFIFLVKFIVPVAIALVLLAGLNIIHF